MRGFVTRSGYCLHGDRRLQTRRARRSTTPATRVRQRFALRQASQRADGESVQLTLVSPERCAAWDVATSTLRPDETAPCQRAHYTPRNASSAR